MIPFTHLPPAPPSFHPQPPSPPPPPFLHPSFLLTAKHTLSCLPAGARQVHAHHAQRHQDARALHGLRERAQVPPQVVHHVPPGPLLLPQAHAHAPDALPLHGRRAREPAVHVDQEVPLRQPLLPQGQAPQQRPEGRQGPRRHQDQRQQQPGRGEEEGEEEEVEGEDATLAVEQRVLSRGEEEKGGGRDGDGGGGGGGRGGRWWRERRWFLVVVVIGC